jgi:sugar O-acyltransferase (sialic acid O-acetyltransferase NeuD family)
MQRYIYGAGGHGKVVLDAMQLENLVCDGFVDDGERAVWCGLTVLKRQNLPEGARLHLAIGDAKTRELIAAKYADANFFSVVHPSAVLAKSAVVSVGTLLAAQSVIAPDAKIGKHCIVNHGAVVDHDCVIGDFCHIAPQACLGGGAILGKGVFVGAGAVVLPSIRVDDGAIIGAGAVVNQHVPANITVVGIPAKPV